MILEDRINSFTKLREVLTSLDPDEKEGIIQRAAAKNPWFTSENINLAIDGVINYLEEEKLRQWISVYSLPGRSLQVGIIMAGNLPLVGFHDFLCVLLAGHSAKIKLSSQDDILLTELVKMLKEIAPDFNNHVEFVIKMPPVDAIIATGSDNSSRYFQKYFGQQPHIIRKNRTSIAVLNGEESDAELDLLAKDIFSYFGMGCRNVSKLFLPQGYDMEKLIPHFQQYEGLANHSKYFNNYEYNKAIYLVNRVEHLDNGFALFTMSQELVSPLSVVYFEEYSSVEKLETRLSEVEDKLQCIVSKFIKDRPSISFGEAQHPKVSDYADNVDTMSFLCDLN